MHPFAGVEPRNQTAHPRERRRDVMTASGAVSPCARAGERGVEHDLVVVPEPFEETEGSPL